MNNPENYPNRTQKTRRVLALLHKHLDGNLVAQSYRTRNQIIEVLAALESNEIAYDDVDVMRDHIKILWGKIARLNSSLGIKHPESGERYRFYPEVSEDVLHPAFKEVVIHHYESQYRSEEPDYDYDLDDFYY